MNEQRLHFLFVTDIQTPVWLPALTEALACWGAVEAVAETEAAARLQKREVTALPVVLPDVGPVVLPVVLIDASQCHDAVKLVESLHAEFPALLIVVLTALPNLRLLRSVYRAGARDCLKMSLDARALRQALAPVLASN